MLSPLQQLKKHALRVRNLALIHSSRIFQEECPRSAGFFQVRRQPPPPPVVQWRHQWFSTAPTSCTRYVLWFGLVHCHSLLWCGADQQSLRDFFIFSWLRLDKTTLSMPGKNRQLPEEARNLKAELYGQRLQWSEKHNKGCLADLRVLFHATSFNPQAPYLTLSKKPWWI